MSQFFEIHTKNPQRYLIKRAIEILHNGGVIVYPTDSAYALGCHIGDKAAMDRIRAIRKLNLRHNLTLVCHDIKEAAIYGNIDNRVFRIMRNITPGPYTFVLKATREVPRRLQTIKRKTIGIRIPEHKVVQALLEEFAEPLMSTTLILPESEYPMTDTNEIREKLEHLVDLIIDSGYCGMETSTVIDFSSDAVEILRQGKGPVDFL